MFSNFGWNYQVWMWCCYELSGFPKCKN